MGANMLAFKWHKDKSPNTRRGSFWIPVLDWKSACIHLSNWRRTLALNRTIRYLTLVSIPKRHPVFVAVDWGTRPAGKPSDLPFVPMCEVEQEALAALKPIEKRLEDGMIWVGQGLVLLDSPEIGLPLAGWPELVLGADLPRAKVKWTKDIRVLFRGDSRQRRRGKVTKDDSE
jgi:hypothetical protein